MKISKKIKNTTKLVLEPFLDKVGFIRKEEVLQYKVNNKSEKNKLISDFFTILKEIKFTPKHIVDVGANRGLWTREVIDCCPNAYYTLFEPQEYLHEYMKDLIENPKVECHAVGVGKQNGNLKFTIVDRDDSCSFIYSEAEAKALGFEQITVPVETLNNFFKDSSKPIPDLIKIDAEGFDLEVLQGATNLLGRTEIILIEAAVVNKLYSNDIKTVIDVLDSYGYTLFDITDLNRPFSKNVLWLTELVFILKGGYIDNQKFN